MFALGFIVPVIAFFFESYPRFFNRKFGVDIWTHLLYLKEYHRQKGIPKKIDKGFLVPGEYDYPPVFITILSKFPIKLVENYEFFFSPFFDAIHLILIFFIAEFISGNLYIALLTQVLYVITPIIVLENSSATPRSLGYTLFTIFMFSLFVFVQTNLVTFLVIAIIAGIFIFLSHRFTAQGTLFFVIFFSFFERNSIYIVTYMVSFVLALLFTNGLYLRVFKGHIGNLKFWYQQIDYRFSHQILGNYKKHKTQDFVFKLYNQFLKFPPFVLAITNPWTLPVIFYFWKYELLSPLLKQAFELVVVSYIISLLVIWVPKLRFLGEGQRYLELTAFPAAFLSSYLLIYFVQKTNYPNLTTLLYVIASILSVLTIVVIQRKAIIKDTLRTLTPDMEQMFKYLKSLKNKPKLLCIPHQITTNTIYHTGCSVFVNADYRNIGKISEIYPFLKIPLRKALEKYNLDAILLNEKYVSIKGMKIKNYKEIKRFGTFVLLKFDK